MLSGTFIGSTFTGRYTIRNRPSSSAIVTDFYVRYYYCTAYSSSTCTYLTSQRITQDLNSGASYSFTSPTLTLPSSATPGTRYIRAHVDATNTVSELSENLREARYGISAMKRILGGNEVTRWIEQGRFDGHRPNIDTYDL